MLHCSLIISDNLPQHWKTTHLSASSHRPASSSHLAASPRRFTALLTTPLQYSTPLHYPWRCSLSHATRPPYLGASPSRPHLHPNMLLYQDAPPCRPNTKPPHRFIEHISECCMHISVQPYQYSFHIFDLLYIILINNVSFLKCNPMLLIATHIVRVAILVANWLLAIRAVILFLFSILQTCSLQNWVVYLPHQALFKYMTTIHTLYL